MTGKRFFCTPIIDRLLNKTLKTDDCWIWQGAINNAGYGLIREESKYAKKNMILVHRAMARDMGIDIENNEIQHTCLNRLCVNPNHLIIGDVKSRTKRLVNKYGCDYIRPKNKYKTCEHCGKTDYYIWYNRRHKHCYPGMYQDIEEIRKKIKQKHK